MSKEITSIFITPHHKFKVLFAFRYWYRVLKLKSNDDIPKDYYDLQRSFISDAIPINKNPKIIKYGYLGTIKPKLKESLILRRN